MKNLADDEEYNPESRAQVFQKVEETGGFVTGVIYRKERPEFVESLPKLTGKESLPKQNLRLDSNEIQTLLQKYK